MVDKTSKISQRRQCELLSIHRSSLYYKPKSESALNLHLMKIIDRQYIATPFYGVPRMRNFINAAYGYKISLNRVERLYKLMDIRAVGPNPVSPQNRLVKVSDKANDYVLILHG
jgi:putative transposase